MFNGRDLIGRSGTFNITLTCFRACCIILGWALLSEAPPETVPLSKKGRYPTQLMKHLSPMHRLILKMTNSEQKCPAFPLHRFSTVKQITVMVIYFTKLHTPSIP